MRNWKYPMLLVSGIGVSYLGNWIYLVALNLLVLEITGSAAAVAGLFIIRPIALLLTNFWSGSIIDRVDKRKLMITIDIARGILVFCLPFIESLWFIYSLLLLINMIGAFFGPSSSIYITKLVPEENRKRFNSIMSMTTSGAFLIGPAISGVLIMYWGTDVCIFFNALTFFICAVLIYLLPSLDEKEGGIGEAVSFKHLMNDWKIVKEFILKARFFITVYVLFQSAMLIGYALDSQEVTFIKQELLLSDQQYGLIVSLTGLGALAGALVSTLLAKRVQLKIYLGGGMFLISVGYALFYSSESFLTAAAAFIFLGFFMTFANAGYATFFQNSIPINIMGRFASIADLIQGLVQIGFTLLLGLFAEWFSLTIVCITFSVFAMIISLSLLVITILPSSAEGFKEVTSEGSVK